MVTERARGEGREEEALAQREPSVQCFLKGYVWDSATAHSQPMVRVKEATSNVWRGHVLESLLVRSDRFAGLETTTEMELGTASCVACDRSS